MKLEVLMIYCRRYMYISPLPYCVHTFIHQSIQTNNVGVNYLCHDCNLLLEVRRDTVDDLYSNWNIVLFFPH